ncbi:MAG: alpha/beta hydrolase [Candidatus Methylomirabilis sp.]|nr:alpha/beta hydrolase [Deltaproteobacteria bacterium]
MALPGAAHIRIGFRQDVQRKTVAVEQIVIAQKFALLYPDRVKKLALCATYARIRPDIHDATSRALLGAAPEAEPGETPAELLDQMDISRLWIGGEDPRRILDKVLPLLFTPAFIERNRPTIEGFLGGAGGEMIKDFSPPIEAFMRQAGACMAHDTVDELHKIRAETLVLVGKEDVLTPMAYSEELAREIPKAHMVVVDACGHGFNFERMAEFNDALARFLKA